MCIQQDPNLILITELKPFPLVQNIGNLLDFPQVLYLNYFVELKNTYVPH